MSKIPESVTSPIPAQQSPVVAVPDEWRESLSELVSAMNEYELSVDERAPHKHKKMMEKANRLLSSSHIDSTETETNFCALKSITDSQVNAVARAFWRRIYAYRNDYGIELPKPLPVEFMAHMATALTWVDREPSPRITEQDAREICESFVDYFANKAMAANYFRGWFVQEGMVLLKKLNENSKKIG